MTITYNTPSETKGYLMAEELWQGGIGLIVIGFGVKYLLPMIKSSLDASTSRSGVDARLHELYQEMLEERAKLSEENARSTAAVVRLTSLVETLQADLAKSREHEARLTEEVTNLRREVAALTDALATARGAKRATD